MNVPAQTLTSKMEKRIDARFLLDYSENFANAVVSNIADEENVTGKGILTLTPSKQVNFFILKLLYGQWQNEIKKLESPYFDYQHEEVRQALNTFMNVLSQHIEVNKDDLKPLISEAVTLTVHWLVFPGQVLNDEVEERGIRQVAGIKTLAKYFRIYQEDLTYLLKEKEEAKISEFMDEWTRLMDQKSTTSTIGKELELLSQVSSISEEALFEEELKADANELEAEDTEAEADLEEAPADMVPDQEEDTEETEDLPEEQPEVEAKDEETDDSHTIIQEEPDEEESTDPDDSVNQKYAKSQETLHDQYKEDQISVAAKHQQKKISSILEAVSVNQEYMFTSELFGGDKETFLEAVEKIESCNSFDETVEMLVSNYAGEYSWNMNGMEVKELLKVVFRRFR